MTTFNLRASGNATFHWTRDLSQWAAIYDISSATIRMQARTSPYQPGPPAYEWVTGASIGGVVLFDPSTDLCTISAPESDMGRMPAALCYDCRLELPGGEYVVMFSGAIAFSPGVTHDANDDSNAGVSPIGDTVMVDGEVSTSPVPLPLSLSAAVAAAQAAAAQAEAFMFPTNLSLDLSTNGEALLGF
jgi:hypothetical protein